MKIQTTRFGELEIPESRIYRFPNGIPGFTDLKFYTFVEREELKPFSWMQSCELSYLAFLICPAEKIVKDYKPKAKRGDLNVIELTDPSEATVVLIVTIEKEITKSTANLRGPILLNESKRLGVQIVIDDSAYSTKHLIFAASRSGGG